MTNDLAAAVEKLKEWFSPYASCAVAFSGGLDSTYLLAAIGAYTQTTVTALTAAAEYVPQWEIREARKTADSLGIDHLVMDFPVPEEIRFNPKLRCYLCKKNLFTFMKKKSEDLGCDILADGTNLDDLGDYRPGLRALQELDVKSPLKECGFTKDLIRQGCLELGLKETAGKPAYACLLTRLPHGSRIDAALLRRIESAELVLHEIGFPAVRVRVHEEGRLARIELASGDMERFLNSELLQAVCKQLTALGFDQVCLDLAGYRQGSMNVLR
jgi:uncharacterized protein (TIGR00268 family)